MSVEAASKLPCPCDPKSGPPENEEDACATCPGWPGAGKSHDLAQKFFAMYAAEIRGPNYGDHARDFVRSMLARAETAGLYTPETP